MLRFFLRLTILVASISTSSALAVEACLYSRSTGSPWGGHAFVVVKSRGRVLEAYGLWPRDKHPDGMAINKGGDFPRDFLDARDLTTPRIERMLERFVCADAGSYDLEDIRALAHSYIGTYGEWRFSDNNCAHFAIRLFNSATGLDFPLVASPLRINRVISRDY